jgi:cobalt/nickel transport protein
MKNRGLFMLAALAVAIALAGLLSPFASTSPDGLERVAADKGFIEKGEGSPVWKWTPIPDYELPGIKNGSISTASAGIIGTLAVFGGAYGIARVLTKKRTRRLED